MLQSRALLVLACCAGCIDAGPDQPSTTDNGSGNVLLLEETARSAGLPFEGASGELMDVALHPDGGVVVYDIQANQVYRMDREARFVGLVGSGGRGPNEYDGVNGLAVSEVGEVYVRSMDGRLLVFDERGEPTRSWRLATSLMHDRKLTFADDGTLVVQETLVRSPSPFRPAGRGFVRMTRDGEVVDTLGPYTTPWDDEAVANLTNQARKHLEWSPLGFAVAAVSSRLALTIVPAAGEVAVHEFPLQRVPYAPEEKQQWETHAAWLRTRVASPDLVPDVPDMKPAFVKILPARTGEIWIQLSSESLRVSPSWVPEAHGAPRVPEWETVLEFLIVQRDGSVKGRAAASPGLDPRAVSGDTVWAYTRSELGTQHLVQLVGRRASGR